MNSPETTSAFEAVAARCPVCAFTVAAPFFDGGLQPLATLGWPPTAAAARNMARFPHDFVQCPKCTHVWNRSFAYQAVPYRNNPNRMFNRGALWSGHLARTRDFLAARLPADPVVVEIGCGEGHFIRGLAEAKGDGRFLGFDVNATPESGRGIEFHARLFEPLVDMASFRPDGVIVRHLLEHLEEPAELIEQLAWGAAALGKPCWLFVESPCIDRVFETDRLADFYYEHASHFTTRSFEAIMTRCGAIDTLAYGYDGEVIYALAWLSVAPQALEAARATSAFAARAQANKARIHADLAALAASGKRVAIWGGSGKGAAFILHFSADAARFPLVVDSDPDKAGTFVPGAGQRIVFRDALKEEGADVVIVATQWRAQDIIEEMKREGIRAGQVLIEHGGRLIDFHTEPHPYRRAEI